MATLLRNRVAVVSKLNLISRVHSAPRSPLLLRLSGEACRSLSTKTDVLSRLVIEPDDRKKLEDETSLQGPELLKHLLQRFKVKSFAYPKISNFQVAASALGSSGAVYFGVNIEFPGHTPSATVHAEQFAVVNAALHKETGLVDLVVDTPPCGHCRQFLNELNGADKLSIHVITADGALRKDLKYYLPDDFGPHHLGTEDRLLKPSSGHKMFLPRKFEAPEDMAEAALQAARQSYAPHTSCPAGVALKLKDGRIYSGSYIESCAFNPSVPPLQAAVVHAMSEGALQSFDDVDRIVLVEFAMAQVSFARQTYIGNKRMHVVHAHS